MSARSGIALYLYNIVRNGSFHTPYVKYDYSSFRAFELRQSNL